MNQKILQGLIRPRVDKIANQLALTLWSRFEAQLDEVLAVAHSALLSDLEAPCPSSPARTAPARARTARSRATRSAVTARGGTSAAGRGAPAAAHPTGAKSTTAPAIATRLPTSTAGAGVIAAGPRARARRKAAAAVEAAPELVVIPRSELATRLAADRATAAGGDAGGYRARPDRGAPIVGAVIGSDRVCKLHGWVGRLVFQRDRHDLCQLPVNAPEIEHDDQAADGAEG